MEITTMTWFPESARRHLDKFLVLVNLVALLGIFVAVQSGRPRFFGMTVIAFAGVILLTVLVFIAKRDVDYYYGSPPRWVETVLDARFGLSLLMLSVGAVLFVGRGIMFVFLMAVFFGITAVALFLSDKRHHMESGRLALLCLGVAELIAVQVFTVAYYAQTMDTTYHVTLARRISTVGSLAAVSTTRYADLPVLHTLGAIGIQITELDARILLGLVFVVIFPAALLAMYVVFRNVSLSVKLALLGAVFIAVNPEFIRWGLQAHVQSLSFVFLTMFAVLMTKWERDVRFTFAAVIIVIAWILTHHLSVFMSIVLLSVPVVAATGWVLSSRRIYWDHLQRPLLQYWMLVISVSVYWWISDLIWEPISWITEFSPRASSGLPTDQFLILVYTDSFELAVASIPFVLDQLHFVMFLGFAGFGLWTVFRPNGVTPAAAFPLAILAFLFAVLLYMPNPLWLPAQGVAFLNRWGIMTILFVLLIPALGLFRIPTSFKGRLGRPIFVVILVLAVFVSIGAGYTDPSITDMAGYEKGDRKYLSSEDIAATEYVRVYSSDSTVFSPQLMTGYQAFRDWTSISGERTSKYKTIEVMDGEFRAAPGLMIIQLEPLREKHVIVLYEPPESTIYKGNVMIFNPVSDQEVTLRTETRNVVYNNQATIIEFVPDEPAAGT